MAVPKAATPQHKERKDVDKDVETGFVQRGLIIGFVGRNAFGLCRQLGRM